ncbi:MAG: hypothetical protein M0R05_03045 [Bacilli bacterium]|nr:hypothetical protein [Bacilli bacterium]
MKEKASVGVLALDAFLIYISSNILIVFYIFQFAFPIRYLFSLVSISHNYV